MPPEDGGGGGGDKGKGRDRAAAAAAAASAAAAAGEAIDYADREGIAGRRVLREWLLRGDRHIQGKTPSLGLKRAPPSLDIGTPRSLSSGQCSAARWAQMFCFDSKFSVVVSCQPTGSKAAWQICRHRQAVTEKQEGAKV